MNRILELDNALTELRSYRNHELAVQYRKAQTVMSEARQFINSYKAVDKALDKRKEAIDLVKATKTEKANDEVITA